MSKPNPTENTRSQRREQAAADALRSLIRDTLLDKFPWLAEEVVEFPLNVSLKMTGEALRFDPDLRHQVLEQAEAFLKPGEAFHPGAVYDFHQQSTRHPGCRPPDALDVFTGYGPLGHPKWSPVSEVLAKELPLKIFSGKELKTEQLQEYGKNDKAYNILGQATLGPLPVPKAYQKWTDSENFALSVQIVETRNSRNHFRLETNVLVGGLLPEEFREMIQEAQLRPLHLAIAELEVQISLLEETALEAWSHQDSHRFENELKNVSKLLSAFSKNFFGK